MRGLVVTVSTWLVEGGTVRLSDKADRGEELVCDISPCLPGPSGMHSSLWFPEGLSLK